MTVCRSRSRSDARRRAGVNAGGMGRLAITHSAPARPRHCQSALPPPQPLSPPFPPGQRHIIALPGRGSIGIHPHLRSSHPLSERRNDSQLDSATFRSTRMPQLASPAPTLCASPCQSSSRKSLPRSDTCSSYPFPRPQKQLSSWQTAILPRSSAVQHGMSMQRADIQPQRISLLQGTAALAYTGRRDIQTAGRANTWPAPPSCSPRSPGTGCISNALETAVRTVNTP